MTLNTFCGTDFALSGEFIFPILQYIHLSLGSAFPLVFCVSKCSFKKKETVLKVFIECVAILLLFHGFWFFDHEVYGISVP